MREPTTTESALLAVIQERALKVEEAKTALDAAVAQARAEQISWTQIGECFRITRQSAWARFHHLDDA